jgi:hypothetical protein
MPDASPAKRVGRAVAYPALRLLEPRFADVVRRLADTRRAVTDEAVATRDAIAGFEPTIASYAASTGESLTFVGLQLRELTDELRAAAGRLEAPSPGWEPPVPAPYTVGFEEAFALRALARLTPPARVLDVRGAERTVGLLLGTLGFAVTGLDARPYAHEHPRLHPLAATLDTFPTDHEPYAAAVCLSGLPGGVDGEDPWADEAASLTQLRGLLAPGGVAVLALAAGEGVGGGRAHYDEARLDALLEGWRVEERLYVREQLAGTWVRVDAPDGRCVALVAATAA